jgi:hypothetical protein
VDEDLHEIARTIRPYLSELVGEQATPYDQQIARLLALAKTGADIDQELSEVLSRSPAIRAWVARTLEDDLHRPPDLQPPGESTATRGTLGYQALLGSGSPVAADKFCCPQGDMVWWRRSVGQDIPVCPDHDLTLVRCE